MKNKPEAQCQKIQEKIRVGKTVYIINHIFTPKQTRQDAWLALITRAEGLKAAKN